MDDSLSMQHHSLPCRPHARIQKLRFHRRSRKALVMTETELKVMAALASIGPEQQTNG
ncbi:MAG: hypothetical protein U0231_09025 [Nitrospiraceae bacterium]